MAKLELRLRRLGRRERLAVVTGRAAVRVQPVRPVARLAQRTVCGSLQ